MWSSLISLVERPYPAPQGDHYCPFLVVCATVRRSLAVTETTDHRELSGSEAVGLKAALEGLF